jgi:hypothetical protein
VPLSSGDIGISIEARHVPTPINTKLRKKIILFFMDNVRFGFGQSYGEKL